MTPWPRVESEQAIWHSSDPLLSHNQRRKSSGIYQTALVPPIARQKVVLPTEVMAEAADAETVISQFDSSPLDSLSFAAVLMRSESTSSSQIEALTASARQLSLAILGDMTSPNASLIAHNVRAMAEAISHSQTIDIKGILSIHQQIMGDSDPANAGRLRSEQVWIGGVSPVVARYVPPTAEKVAPAMSDLVDFVGRTDIPPLVHAAIAHAQFETIHPFTDGNGRTGRALVTAMLRRAGLSEHAPIPLSAGLLSNTDTYFAALESYREGDVAHIVSRFSQAVLSAIENATILRAEVGQIQESILATSVRRTSSLATLANICVAEGAFTAQTLSEAGIALPTAYRQLDRLVSLGILQKEHKIRGQQVWGVPAVFAALDRFATRAGRRTWR